MTDAHASHTERDGGLSRRRLLRAGASVGAVALGGSALLLGAGSPAAAHGTLNSHNEIWDVPTYYQNLETGAADLSSFDYQPNLYAKLEEWLRFHYANTPPSFRWPGRIYLNGVHDDDPNDVGSMHTTGRAADISAVMMTYNNGGFLFDAFNARYNTWRNSPQMPEYRRRYWGCVCAMNIFFKFVLHYHSNAVHHNHVHVDNQESNGTNSVFTTGSRSQVLAVQAACNYIYGFGTAIDGGYGPQTASHASAVLGFAGMPGAITDSQWHWHRFCWAAMRSGHGLAITGV